jgi:Flp pilus assembly protein TadG
MLVGIIEFGRAWNVSQTVTYAARQGARIAAVGDKTMTDAELSDAVLAAVHDVIANNKIDTTGCSPGCVDLIVGLNGGQDTPVTVKVGVPYQFMILAPVMRLNEQIFLDENEYITLQSTAVMRNE